MATQEMSDSRKLAAFDRGERSGSIGMVLLVAFALVGAALGFLLIGRSNAQPYILALLSVLAVIGVFSLFAGAAGILRIAGKETGHATVKAAADGAPDGIIVTDASGRVIYANAAYLALTGAATAQAQDVNIRRTQTRLESHFRRKWYEQKIGFRRSRPVQFVDPIASHAERQFRACRF